MSDIHEKKAKKILGRDWLALREAWLGHVPDIDEPGEPPQLMVSELEDLDEQLAKIPKDQVAEISDDIPGVRPGVLHEGIFLIHKAVHVLGSALVHASSGMCTWSVSSAYHSAFFAMKSAMGILGVSAIDTKERGHFLLDVWGPPHNPKKKHPDPIIFLARTPPSSHHHLWAYFQRTIEKTINYETILDDPFRTLILELDETDFGRHRNDLHYRTARWDLGDLHQCVEQEGFGRYPYDALEFDRPDFSLILAFGMVRLARAMLVQLAETSAVIATELRIVDDWLSLPFNQLFRTNFPGAITVAAT